MATKKIKKTCQICKTRFQGRRDAKTCSPACRKRLQRNLQAELMEKAARLESAVGQEFHRLAKQLYLDHVGDLTQVFADERGAIAAPTLEKPPEETTTAEAPLTEVAPEPVVEQQAPAVQPVAPVITPEPAVVEPVALEAAAPEVIEVKPEPAAESAVEPVVEPEAVATPEPAAEAVAVESVVEPEKPVETVAETTTVPVQETPVEPIVEAPAEATQQAVQPEPVVAAPEPETLAESIPVTVRPAPAPPVVEQAETGEPENLPAAEPVMPAVVSEPVAEATLPAAEELASAEPLASQTAETPEPAVAATAQPATIEEIADRPAAEELAPAETSAGEAPMAAEMEVIDEADEEPVKKTRIRSLSLFHFNRAAFAMTSGAIAVITFLVLGGFLFANFSANKGAKAKQVGASYNTGALKLGTIKPTGELAVSQVNELEINGLLKANDTLVISPTKQPDKPITGQIYYDKTSNVLYYYNGTQFVSMSSSASVTSLGGASGVIGLGNGLSMINNQLAISNALIEQINAASGQGVKSLNGQTGDVTITSGVGIAINGTTISNNGVLSLTGTANQVSVSGSTGNVTLTLPQDIAATSSPSFAGLAVSGTATVGTLQQTSPGNNLNITAGNDSITFTANGRTFVLPGTGPLSQTICTSGFSCAVGPGTAVQLQPGTAQGDPGSGPSIFINNTGGGGLLTLQSAGTDRFVVANNGNVTAAGTVTGTTLNGTTGINTGAGAGTQRIDASGNLVNIGTITSGLINGQTISSSANFTGTLAVQGAGGITVGVAGTINGSVNFANSSSNRQVILQGLSPTGVGNATISLPSIAGGSSDTICLATLGNCAGSGGGIIGSGTPGSIAKFTNGNTIADSNLSEAGSTLTYAGNVVVNAANGFVGNLVNLEVNGSSKLVVDEVGNIVHAGTLTVNGTGASSIAGSLTIGTGLGVTSGGATIGGTVTLSSLNTAGVVHTNGSGVLSTSPVVLGTDTTGNYVSSLGALTGLSTTGNTGAGSTPTLSVNYGSSANTSVQGNTMITCASGTGNLTGGGNTITLGSGGSCNNITITDSPTFIGTLTVQGSGGIVVGVPGTTAGTVTLANSTNTNLSVINSAAPSGTGTATFTLPVIAGGTTDTICLRTLANCNASGPAGGDLAGNYPDPTIAKLQGTTLTLSSLVSGDVLQYNGTAIVNGHITNANLTAGTFTNITGTGALNAGSITTGFGTISTNSNITTTATIQGATLNATSVIQLNGNDINATGTLSNVAYLAGTGPQTFTGNNLFTGTLAQQNATNSANAFQIRNAASASVLNVNTSTGAVQLGTATNNSSLRIFTAPGATPQVGLDTAAGAATDSVFYGANGSRAKFGYDGVDQNAQVVAGAGKGFNVTVNTSTSALTITSANVATFTGTLAVGGGTLTVGVPGTTTGSVNLANSTSSRQVILQGLNPSGTGNATIQLPTIAGGATDVVCLVSLGNCAGSGGGITGSGTIGTIPVFTGTGSIGNSTLTQSGSALTASGTLAIQGANSLSLGTASSATGSIGFKNSTNANTLTLQSGATGSNLTLTLPTADGSNGYCLQTNGSGALSFNSCTGGPGGGVTSLDGLAGVLTLNNSTGSGSAITIDNASTSVKGIAQFNSTNFTASSGTINTIQDIATTSSPVFVSPNATTGVNTGAGAGTQRIDASGNLVNIGDITGTSAVNISAGGTAQNLTINASTSGQIRIGGVSTGDILLGGGVSSTGCTVSNSTGDLACTRNINASTGVLQTAGVTRIDNSGNATLGTITSGLINGQTISSTANFTGTVAIQGANALTLGTSSTSTGAIIFKGSGGVGTVTLAGPTTPNTGNYTLSIPTITANDTICVATLLNCSATGSAGGDLTGTYPNPTIAKLQSTTLTLSSLASGDVLQYNGSAIVNGHITNANLTAGTFSSITGTGALAAGSIASGFGTISTANNITTTATVHGNTLTAGSTNQAQIDASGNITTTGTLGVQNSTGITIGIAGSVAGKLNLANGTNTNLTVLTTAAPSGTGTATITIPTIAGGTSDTVCLVTLGNCAGSGSGIIGSGTPGTIAVFTGSNAIGDSILSQSGTTLTVGGNLVANTAPGFTGNLINLAVNGSSKFTVDQIGNSIQAGTLTVNGTGASAIAGSLSVATGLTVNAGGAAVTGGITATTGDITLAANTAKFVANSAVNASTSVFTASVSGDSSNKRFAIFADGKFEWGNGTAVRDTNLYRSAADFLKTDDSFLVGGFIQLGSGGTISNSAGNGKTTLQLTSTSADTGITLGGDTNLYRSAADTLKTDDALIVGTLGTGGNTALCSNAGQISTCGTGTGTPFVQGGNSFGAAGDLGTNDSFGLNIRTNGNTQVTIGTTGQALFKNSTNSSTGFAVQQSGSSTSILNIDTTSNRLLTIRGDQLNRSFADSTTAFQIQNSAGTSNLFVADTTNSRIGLGVTPITTAGSGLLQVGAASSTTAAQGISFGGDTAANLYRSAASTLKTDGNFRVGTYGLNVDATGRVGIAATENANILLTVGTTGLPAPPAFNTSSSTLGIQANPVNSGTGNITGIYGQPISSASGTIGFLTGVQGSVRIANAGGTVTNGYALYAGSPTVSSGAITTATGLYIQDQKITGVTTGYGVYQAGTADLNYFGGIVALNTLGTTNTSTFLCQNASNQIAGCSTTGAGAPFVQGGNSFAAPAVLGTNDSNSLSFETNNVTQATIAVGGATTFQNSTNSTAAFQVQNSAGTGNNFVVDTTNNIVGFGMTPVAGASSVQIAGSLSAVGAVSTSVGLNISSSQVSDPGLISKGARGGSINQFDVVVMNSSGQVATTTTARDPRVYGVSNTTVGAGNFFVYVALLGNTTINADTGAVAVGDQLVTSTTAGRVTVDNNATTGIIGTALSSKAGGSNGTVYVAVRPVGGQSTPNFRSTSTSAFQIQNASGAGNLFIADTTNTKIGIGAAPSAGGSTLQVTGGISLTTLGTADTTTTLCRNSSNQIATCTTGAGSAFVQGGNSFGADGDLGTNDGFGLNFRTSGLTQASIAVGGATLFKNTTNSTSAFQIQNTGAGVVFGANTTNSTVGVGALGNTTDKLYVTTSSIVGLTVNQTGSSNILQLQNSGTNVATVSNTGAVLLKNSTDSSAAFQVQPSGSSTPTFIVDTSGGRVGIGKIPTTGALDVNGTIAASNSFQINNTSLNSGYIVKNYTAGGTVAANDVVVFNSSGNVVDTTTARDVRIAGIANNAQTVGNAVAVIIGGNAQVTADTGAVAIGDQLVTSATSGQVTVDNQATTGILGTAMSTKTAGSSGLVSIVVRPVGGQYEQKIRPASNSSQALLVQNTSGFNVLQVDTFNGVVALGGTGTVTGKLQFKTSTGSNSITIVGPATNPTGNYTLTIPTITANANLCTDNSVCAGYAPSSGSGSYINNTTTPQTADFNITGAGTVGGNFTNNGTALFQNSANSTTGFQVQNSGGTGLIVVDTTNSKVGIGGAPTAGGAALQVTGNITSSAVITGTNVTASSGNVTAGVNLIFGQTSVGPAQGALIQMNYTVGTGGVTQNDPVVIDASNGRVVDTATARDVRVMGVAGQTQVSGSNAVISIAGVATVNVDAPAVAIGDQLVTSTTSGQATVDNNATTGILGYAVSSKAGGSAGTVRVRLQVHSGQYAPKFQNATDSASAFQIQNAAGNNIFTADTTGTGAVSLGKASTLSGKLQFQSASGSGSISVVPANPGSTAYTLTLPAENGTLCSTGSVCTGYAPSSGSGSYIQNGTAPQTADFNITGAGTVGGNFTNNGAALFKNSSNSTAAFDVQTSGGTSLLVVDTTNSRVGIQSAGVAGYALTVNGGSFLQAGNGVIAANIKNFGTGTILNAENSTGSVFSIANAGATLFKNTTNSVTAFQIQDSGSTTPILNIDTTNRRVGIGTSAPGNALDVRGASNIQGSATAEFTVQSSSFVKSLTVDTTNNLVGIGAVPTAGGSTLQVTGGISLTTLATADTTTTLCRNSSNQIATCTTGTGAAFIQGGNSFGAAGDLGTNDGFALNLRTSGLTQASIGTAGATLFKNTTNSTSAFQVQSSGSTTPVFNVDTTNNRVGIGTATPGNTLDVAGSIAGTFITSSGSVQAGASYTLSQNNASGYYSKGFLVGTGGVSANDVIVVGNDSGNTRVFDTTTARDTRVVGVAVTTTISGSSTAVAIGGAFQVNADTAAVAIGDQLVTSTTSGRVTADNNATTGIVGIALSSKAGGSTGLVNIYLSPVGGQSTPNFRSTSTTAFQIQNVSGAGNLFVADTTNTKLGIGVVPGTTSSYGVLQVGAAGTTADQGITFGADTVANLYRSAAGTLKTDGNLIATGTLTSGLINGQTISSAANFTGTLAVATSVTTPIVTSTGALSVTAASGANNLSLNGGTTGQLRLNGTSTGDILIGGGQGTTGCTIYNASGNIDCDGTFNSQTLGTNTSFTGTVAFGTLGTTNTATFLCRNGSGQLAGCSSTGAGAAFVQGGNSFAATAVLGTNDSNSLSFETNNVTQATIAVGGATLFKNSANSTAAFQIQPSGSTTPLFIADTTNSRIGLGVTPITTAGSGLLQVGAASSTTAAQGINFGGDAVANLYRSDVGVLQTDGSLSAGANLFAIGRISTELGTDNDTRAALDQAAGGAGKAGLVLGPGTSAVDVNLYRDSANVLKTDDQFVATWANSGSNQSAVSGQNTISTAAAGGTSRGISGTAVVQISTGTQAAAAGVLASTDYSGATGATVTSLAGTIVQSTYSGASPGGTITNQYGVWAKGVNNNTSGTPTTSIQNAVGLQVDSQGSSSLGTQNVVGISIATQTAGSSTNIGLQFGSGTTVASGIQWGTDTNLYRSAANILKTDDTFDAAAFKVAGVAGASTTCSGGQVLTNQVVVGGITTGGTCAGGAGVTDLQGAYNGGNTITTTNARDLSVTLANTATDSNFIINVASSSTGQLKVQNNGTDVLAIGSAGQLALSTTGSTGGLVIGGDAVLYRSTTNTLRTTGDFVTKGLFTGNTTGNNGWANLGTPDGNDILDFWDTSNNQVGSVSANGNVMVNPFTASTTAFQVQNFAGTSNTLVVDTLNSRIGIGAVPGTEVLTVQDASGATIALDTSTNLASDSAYLQVNNRANFGYSNGNVIINDNGANKNFQLSLNGSSMLSILSTGLTAIGPSAVAANSVLTVGTNTTAASGGLYFGTDTNLYRSAANTLKTDDSLVVATNLTVIGSINLDSAANASIYEDSTTKATVLVNTNAGASTVIQSDSLFFEDTTGYNDNFSILNTGATKFQNRVNSTTAFQVQNAAGTSNLFVADTTNSRIGLGVAPVTTAGTGLLQVGAASSTTADQGISFGGDAFVNLYRVGSGVLKTDAQFQANGFQSFSDSFVRNTSTTAFRVQNAGGAFTLLTADTTNSRVGLGVAPITTAGSGLLQVGAASSTTADQGISFGGDTVANLYRSSAGVTKTDGQLYASGSIASSNNIQAQAGGSAQVTVGFLSGSFAAVQFGSSNDALFYRPAAGQIIYKPSSGNDSTTAFRIQNAAGSSTVFSVDTTNNAIAVTSASTTAVALSVTNNAALTNSVATISGTGVMTTTGNLLALTATNATTSTGLLTVNAAGLTSGYAQNINVNGTTTLTTGGALKIVGPTGAATMNGTTGLVSIQSTGAFTNTTAGVGGLLQISTGTLTSTAASIVGTGVMTTTGSLLTLTANSATTTTGLLAVNATGLTSGYAVNINVNNAGTVLTTGGALNIVGPAGNAAMTGGTGLVKIQAAGNFSTATGVGGLLQVSTVTTIGTAASIIGTGIMTTTGNLLTVTGNAATTATGLVQINGTGLTTGSALTINAGTGTAISVNNGSTIDLASSTAGGTAVLKLAQNATTTACASAAAEGTIIKNTGGTQVGHICIDGPTSGTPNKLRFYAEQFSATSTDVAENYSDVSGTLQPGDLVALSNGGANKAIEKANASNASRVIGVISSSPGILLSGISESDGGTDLTNPKPVALSGRIPTKVSTENGPIEIGDHLTLSSTPGVAMKATSAGLSIGRALANYSGGGIGSIEVMANVGYYEGQGMGGYIQNGGNAVLNDLTVGGLLGISDMQATGTATVNNLLATTANIQTLTSTNSTSDALTVNGTANIGNLVATGNITSDSLNVTGSATLNSLSVVTASISGDLNVVGATNTGSLTVTGSASIANLTVTGNAHIVGDILVDGHVITAGGQPTGQVLGATGTGAGASVTISGTDTTGTITITTGSAPTAGDLAKILFSKTYGQSPHIVLSASNDKAAGLRFFKGNTSATDFMFNALDTPQANTTYTFDYFIAQ